MERVEWANSGVLAQVKPSFPVSGRYLCVCSLRELCVFGVSALFLCVYVCVYVCVRDQGACSVAS